MKKLLCMILSACIIFTFTGCRAIHMADKHRDYEGYIQFIVEFNTGLFAYTNTDSVLAYSPSNPKLQKEFEYGDKGVRFSAEYEEDRIVYTVTNPSDDRIPEMKTFTDIYNVYRESWNYFCEKTDIGTVYSGLDENNILSIVMIISGNSYNVTFYPNDEMPQIVYEKIAIA